MTVGSIKEGLMDARSAVAHVVSKSGKTARAVSIEMGLTKNFITNTVARRSAPRLDTFARIAKVCGYEVVLRSSEEEVTIEYQGK
jgi:DNA-binding phage protein